MLLPAIERLTVEVNDSSIASLRATQLTLTSKLKPGNGQNGPGWVKKEEGDGGREGEGEKEREGGGRGKERGRSKHVYSFLPQCWESTDLLNNNIIVSTLQYL